MALLRSHHVKLSPTPDRGGLLVSRKKEMLVVVKLPTIEFERRKSGLSSRLVHGPGRFIRICWKCHILDQSQHRMNIFKLIFESRLHEADEIVAGCSQAKMHLSLATTTKPPSGPGW